MSRNRRRWWGRRWWTLPICLAVAVIVALVAVIVAAVADQEPDRPGDAGRAEERPLTQQEADRLAVARFGNYRAGGLRFTATVTNAAGPLALTGDIDSRAHIGYAAAEFADDGRPVAAVLRWDSRSVSTWMNTGDGRTPPPAFPAAPPWQRALQPTGSTLDTVLRLLLGLSSDRPENAVLLRQSDARWLRRDTLGDTTVDVLRGPSAGSAQGDLRYWLAPSGQLLRVEADFVGARAVVDLDPAGFVPVPRTPDG